MVSEVYHPYHDIFPAIMSARGETFEALVRDAATSMFAAFDNRPDFLNLLFIEIVEFKSVHMRHMFETFFPKFMTLAQGFIEVAKQFMINSWLIKHIRKEFIQIWRDSRICPLIAR